MAAKIHGSTTDYRNIMQLDKVGVRSRLAPFSAQVEAGLQIHLIGANGAGKSTLLARIAGLLPGEGTVLLAGKSLPDYQGHELARYRAYLPQQQPATAVMPLFQYLALHLPGGTCVDRPTVVATIGYLCQKLRLVGKLPHRLNLLSGGEWQRVRLAAIFLQVWPDINSDSKILLLDEPANSLDVGQKAALNDLVRKFCQAGRSVIISTHDLNHSLQQADQIWLLAAGRVVIQGKAKQVMQPKILSKIFGIEFQRQRFHQRDWII
ncbi:vitamin B12 ABC transporter ATP-binding protein BtuD [Candidatus Fukatsuia endosymbiont of Tuberolachnus salignus]|uniref:vitamin B12 ABC transporter ATP-binding protein BtuD n=1 Tax=Candidatus Fukatsuia endosymbiont of Tuberolachnus salignus TaxID=3077957 RepID=UPI00313A99FE